MSRLKITQDEESDDQIPVEVLAQSVVAIANGIRRLNSTPLSRRAIDVLVAAQTKVALRTVSHVLDGLNSLEETYLKKKGK